MNYPGAPINNLIMSYSFTTLFVSACGWPRGLQKFETKKCQNLVRKRSETSSGESNYRDGKVCMRAM